MPGRDTRNESTDAQWKLISVLDKAVNLVLDIDNGVNDDTV